MWLIVDGEMNVQKHFHFIEKNETYQYQNQITL